MIAFLQKMNRLRKWRRRARQAEERRAKLLSFGKHAIGLLADTKQGLFVVDPEDDFVSRRLLRYGEYGSREIQQCFALMPEQSRLLVVGTHIGAIVIPLAKKCGSVVAVEANPRTFRFLQANLALNGCQNVTALNFAANDEAGKIEFILSRDNSGGSKRRPSVDDVSYWYDNPEVQQVDAYRLDEKLEGTSFDLVFMDIEGSEYFALKGMQRILCNIQTLIIEFIPHHIAKVAGVTVIDFVNLILPHFEAMYVPSIGRVAERSEILNVLQDMSRRGQSDDGLIFVKQYLPQNILDQLRMLRTSD